MHRIIMVGLIAFFSAHLAAQEPAPGQAPAAPDAAAPTPPPNIPNPEQLEREVRRAQAQMKKMQRQQLEMLKETNPEEYKKQSEALERREKISKIVEQARAGKLTKAAAADELRPLVKAESQEEILGLKSRIARLEKKLQSLKGDQENPDRLVQRRIKELLGEHKLPQPGDIPMPGDE